jgi:phage tail protein X
MEGIRSRRVDLDEVGELCLALYRRLGVENIDHEVAILDANHGVVGVASSSE